MKNIFLNHCQQAITSILLLMGLLWLPLEAYEGLSNKDVALPFYGFLAIAIIAGLIHFTIDGFFLKGFLKDQISIKTHYYDTIINIEFGDFFSKKGWKAIAVNDFFDSSVDEKIISSKSLHGQSLNLYWKNNSEDWRKQVVSSLRNTKAIKESRSNGNQKRYAIGSTACANSNQQNFLFFALGKTDVTTNITLADTTLLVQAIRGMLLKARAVCADQELVIPLVGSGLSRVGVKKSILVDLIILLIQEETKNSKITSKITIVLPIELKGHLNLKNYVSNWS